MIYRLECTHPVNTGLLNFSVSSEWECFADLIRFSQARKTSKEGSHLDGFYRLDADVQEIVQNYVYFFSGKEPANLKEKIRQTLQRKVFEGTSSINDRIEQLIGNHYFKLSFLVNRHYGKSFQTFESIDYVCDFLQSKQKTLCSLGKGTPGCIFEEKNNHSTFSTMPYAILDEELFVISPMEVLFPKKLLMTCAAIAEHSGIGAENNLAPLPTFLPYELRYASYSMGTFCCQNAKEMKPLWLLRSFEHLHWKNSDLSIFPPEILGLGKLLALNLNDNRLIEIPPEIRNLSLLQSLSLSGNRISRLPQTIGSLNFLRLLYLGNNFFTAFPPEIYSLKKLEELDLRSNSIDSVDGRIRALSALRYLNLGQNCLPSLPPEMGDLSNLQELHVEGNCLTRLPEDLGRARSLSHLFVDENQLIALPESLSSLGNLRVCSAKNNGLLSLSEALVDARALQSLHVDHNRLTSVPPRPASKQEMRYSMENNWLSEQCSSFVTYFFYRIYALFLRTYHCLFSH